MIIAFMNDDFRSVFQFDVRFTNRLVGGNNIEIICGEIKSGKGRKVAYMQVIERLLIVRKAFLCLTNMPPNAIHLRGEVFTNIREWKNVLPALVDILNELKIKTSTIEEIFPGGEGFYPFLTVDVHIVGYG